MNLMLAFGADGSISGDGIDDIAGFVIDGSFDVRTSEAAWDQVFVCGNIGA